ncbi:AsmA-like C-terminal region-containing protein [Pleomorphovibrio marinus]|uniref:AsmA-like C-terminal region-containing protein n=1 Tax=Pleomorphovibrio marinus TaxID=2164132 RepID=UPI000E0B0956|nr:AsmA-like C-terminal region-containing protein [Pleomorphovibrio marinus]
MKAWLLRISISIFLLFAIVLAFAVALLTIQQETLTKKALEMANRQFTGQLTVEKSRVSLFQNFPYISIDLRDVAFYETKLMDSRPFYKAGHLYLGFNFWDIIEGNHKIKSVLISDGHLDVVKNPNGEFNLLAAKGIEKKNSESEGIVDFALAKAKVSNFTVSYKNHLDASAYLLAIDYWGASMRKRDDVLALEVDAEFKVNVLIREDTTFFSNKQVRLALNLNYHTQEEKINIEPSRIQLEEALFAASGIVGVLDNGLDVDVRVEGQKPDFNLFAAFLPEGTAEALNAYRNEGEVFFRGGIRGMIAEGVLPAVSAEFGCENAFFQRTDNNLKVDELRFFGFFTNGEEQSLKTSELHVQNFNAKPEQGNFQGDLVIRNFEEPHVKVKLKADIDLGFVGDFFGLDKFQGISGKVIVDMDFDELVELEASALDMATAKRSLQSTLSLKDLNFSLRDYPHLIQGVNANAILRAGEFSLDSLYFRIGKSDFNFKGQISDFPAMLHRLPKPVNFSLTTKSSHLHLPELLLNAEKKEKIRDLRFELGVASMADELFNFEYLPKGIFQIRGLNAMLENYPHKFHDLNLELEIEEDNLEVKKLSGQIDQSDFNFQLSMENYPKWLREEFAGFSSISWKMQSNKLLINDLLTYNGVNYLPKSWAEEYFSSLDISGKATLELQDGLPSSELLLENLSGRTQRHPLKLEGFKGKVKWENSYLSIENFGGKMGVSEFDFDLGLSLEKEKKTKKDFFHFRAKALDLDALMGFKGYEGEEDTNHAEASNVFKLPFRDMEFKADIAKLNYHRYWLEQVRAELRTTPNHFLHLDTLGLKVANGSLGLRGYLNGSDPEEIYLHSRIVADQVDLDKLLFKFENFGQDVLINENLKGRVSGTIDGKFRIYPDLTPIIEKSEAKMDLTVYEGTLVNFSPFLSLSDYFADRNLRRVRFDTLSNTFDLKGAVLHIPRMNINSSLGFMEISGRQSLDKEMDLTIRLPLSLVTRIGFRSLFGGRSREEVDPDQEDAIVIRDTSARVRFININMQGKPDDFRVTLGRFRK